MTTGIDKAASIFFVTAKTALSVVFAPENFLLQTEQKTLKCAYHLHKSSRILPSGQLHGGPHKTVEMSKLGDERLLGNGRLHGDGRLVRAMQISI